MKPQYKALINFQLQGIPCLIGVIGFVKALPWRGRPDACPSSDDWHGYRDVDFDLLDLRGKRAAWLDCKLTPQVRNEIEDVIENHDALGSN